MFTGIHILEPRVFEYIPRGVYSDIVPTFYNPALKKGEKIAAHITDANWFELSTIPRYLDISLAMMNGASVLRGRKLHRFRQSDRSRFGHVGQRYDRRRRTFIPHDYRRRRKIRCRRTFMKTRQSSAPKWSETARKFPKKL